MQEQNNKTYIMELAHKWRAGTLSNKERQDLEQWDKSQPDEILNLEAGSNPNEILNRLLLRVNTEIEKEQVPQIKVIKLWPRIAAAASIILAIGAGIFFYASYYAARHPDLSRHLGLSRHLDDRRDLLDIAPGKNTATITLANGSTIVLSDAKTGVVVGAESLRYNDGSAVDANDSSRHLNLSRHLDDRRTDQRELNETAKNNNSSELNLLNSTDKRSLPYGRDDVRGVDGRGSRNNARGGLLTAATPRGGTYQITLPDGTKVWLNAASSLKFPASFGSLKTRSVELTGEGYFEVAKDKAHPFIVATAKQEVQVLGTHFNINAYNDEGSTKTTLLEGSVSVSSLPLYSSSRGKRSDERPLGHATSRDLSYRRDDGGGRDDVVLKPNQESVLTNNAQIRVTDVTAEDAVAWKNGDFVFRGEALESVMRKVARWYDVEVVYADDVPRDVVIGGYVSRSRNISVVLERMAKTGRIKFKIEGKKITVMK